jgi:PAS domain S-box-containing protein
MDQVEDAGVASGLGSARFLAEASHALASSLDYQTTLATVARLAIPTIADCCMIYLLEDDNSVLRAAAAHRDPEREREMLEILARYPVRTDARSGTSRVLRTGNSELLTSIPDSLLVDLARDERHLAFLRTENLRSLMSVPLFTRGRTIGAITLLSSREGRCYGHSDLAFAEELARRAALAVDNARLYRAACDAKAAAEHALEARQRSEQLLAAVLDNMPAPISIKDLGGRYVLVNRRFAALAGTDRATLVGRRDRELFPREVADGLHTDHARVVADRTPLEIEESLPFGGHDRTYLSIKFPLLDDAGRPHSVCAISTDVTERRRLEDQLAQSHKMEALGRLAGGVAHDFCRGRELRREIIDLNQIINGLECMLTPALVGIQLVTNLDPHPPLIEADAGELEQLVLNLALNARDALDEGGELVITTENRVVHDEDCVILTVADTGHGMDATTRERVFEPFFTTKEQGRGTGLGLFTVYATVRRYGGSIEVRSQPGSGSVFEVRLPRAQGIVVTEVPAPDVETRGETILVVEDDNDVRTLVSDVLEFNGYRVLVASNGPMALDLVYRHRGRIDLLLSDIVMPGMNGCELARQMRLRSPQLRVLYISGYTGDILTRYGVSPGAVLPKPYSLDVLRQRVRDALGPTVPAPKLEARPGWAETRR